jgi:GNAT superfamily N-acetyltransferase
METRIRAIDRDQIDLLSAIPIAFRVESVLDVELVKSGMEGIRLHETAIEKPYKKDYDAYEDGPPEAWLKRFDTSNWGFFLLKAGERVLGGSTIACWTPELDMLEGRSDLAVLWDIRVQPGYRRQGLGAQLFGHAVQWCRDRGFKQMRIETQNVNVPACRFYAKQGCHLGVIHRFAYAKSPAVAHEVMLIWYYDL